MGGLGGIESAGKQLWYSKHWYETIKRYFETSVNLYSAIIVAIYYEHIMTSRQRNYLDTAKTSQ